MSESEEFIAQYREKMDKEIKEVKSLLEQLSIPANKLREFGFVITISGESQSHK